MKRASLLLLLSFAVFMTVAFTRPSTAVSSVSPAVAQTAHAEFTPIAMNFPVGHGNEVNAFYDSGLTGRPWLVIVHGGYWDAGSGAGPTISADCKHELARRVACFGIDYRLVPSVHWPTPLLDVEHAVTWIRSHAVQFGLDPRRGFIYGGSAGGLLSDIAALDLGYFAGAVSAAGVADSYAAAFDSRQTNRRLKVAAKALHDNVMPWQDYASWKSARGRSHIVATRKTPFLLLHSAGDRTVDISMTADFRAQLLAKKFDVAYHVVPGSAHSLGTYAWKYLDPWMTAILTGGK